MAAMLICFALLVGAWAFVTAKLSSAPREKLGPIENRLRGNRVTEAILPPQVVATRPPWLDLAEHFVVYLPFGLMAGAAGTIAARWRGNRARKIATATFALAAAAWALHDEYRQIVLPDRSADWDDLIAGWSGIAAGLLIYYLCTVLIRKILKRTNPAKPQT